MSVFNIIYHQFLTQRGLTEESLQELKNVSKEDLKDIRQAKNSVEWLNFLYHNRNLEITVDADYDADGVLGGITAYYALKALGFKVNLYIPLASDGYGLGVDAVDKLVKQYPNTQMILTVDNGVVAYSGIDEAKSKNLKVLVSDHHLGSTKQTSADVVVDVNQVDDNYSFKGICGTTTIWKLMSAYASVLDPTKYEDINDLLVLSGITTITDMMPVLDENRYILTETLNLINRESWVDSKIEYGNPVLQPVYWGLKAILEVLIKHGKHDSVKDWTEEDFGFYIGPMLNSARRVFDDPTLSYKIFLAQSYDEAYEYAEELFNANKKRQEIVKEVSKTILDTAMDKFLGHGLAIDADITSGYAGLISNALTRKLKVPSVVFADKTEHDGVIGGSARSIEGISLVDIFDRVYKARPDIVVQYGGHAGAAGISIKKMYLDEFNQEFDKAASELVSFAPGSVEEKNDSIDLSLALREENWFNGLIQVMDFFKTLAPFGLGFEKPVFSLMIPNANVRYMGNNNQHIKWNYLQGFDVISWNASDDYKDTSVVKVTGNLSINEFRGKKTLQLIASEVEYI